MYTPPIDIGVYKLFIDIGVYTPSIDIGVYTLTILINVHTVENNNKKPKPKERPNLWAANIQYFDFDDFDYIYNIIINKMITSQMLIIVGDKSGKIEKYKNVVLAKNMYSEGTILGEKTKI